MVKNKKMDNMVEKIGNDIKCILKACLEYQEDGYNAGLAEGYKTGYDAALADLKGEKGKSEETERSKRIAGRADAYDNGYANGLRDGRAEESEYFTVLATCKADMRHEFHNLHTLAKIDKLTDKQMEDIAGDIGDQLEEYYSDALRLAVEAKLDK